MCDEDCRHREIARYLRSGESRRSAARRVRDWTAAGDEFGGRGSRV
jgi:hypothetical protein